MRPSHGRVKSNRHGGRPTCSPLEHLMSKKSKNNTPYTGTIKQRALKKLIAQIVRRRPTSAPATVG